MANEDRERRIMDRKEQGQYVGRCSILYVRVPVSNCARKPWATPSACLRISVCESTVDAESSRLSFWGRRWILETKRELSTNVVDL
jgi:hypothetical protein